MNGLPALSDILANQCAECVEIALAAQGYLQRCGMHSAFVCGNVHWKHGDEFTEFNEPHSFVMINGAIYDPANPVVARGGSFLPSLYMVAPAHLAAWEAQAEKGVSFMQLTNAIDKREALFGVSMPHLSWSPKNIVEAPALQTKTADFRPPLRQSL
jgi:hypothetical protein